MLNINWFLIKVTTNQFKSYSRAKKYLLLWFILHPFQFYHSKFNFALIIFYGLYLFVGKCLTPFSCINSIKTNHMIRRLMLLAMIIGGIHFTCSSQNINSENSKIEFRVANLGANKVKGNFSGMKGNVKFDPKNISTASFDVCIDATTFNTRMKKRDKAVKGEKYLDVANYPEICFKSTGVSRNGMSYKLTGILTMHDESKEVEIIFNYSRQTFTGKLQINRLDFKVGPKSGVLVGKVIDITITCVIE